MGMGLGLTILVIDVNFGGKPDAFILFCLGMLSALAIDSILNLL